MTQEPFDIHLSFLGEPFNRAAVIHTLRHLAMRVGWRLNLGAGRGDLPRLLYANADDPSQISARDNDVVILSSNVVRDYFAGNNSLIPITQIFNHPVPQAPNDSISPFPHSVRSKRSGWISSDVVAGAYWAMNLLYEQRTRASNRDGWIMWREDWMARVGLREPAPLADEWLNEIARAAGQVGWRVEARPLLNAKFVVVLTHDVDYLPSPGDHGAPRFLRALTRQVFHRHSPRAALKIARRYIQNWRREPYDNLRATMREEAARGAVSSFQFVVERHSRFDPAYARRIESRIDLLKEIAKSDWEVCLHGSYPASREGGRLEKERARLELLMAAPVAGYRQHYLNFSPAQLFDEVERARLRYDMSVGYNDASGARAGSLFPFVPFDLGRNRASSFWEIPFVLMDTTLATSYRFSARDALEHSMEILSCVGDAGGCISLIWHQEQLGDALDPDYGRVYYDLLDWIRSRGGVMTNGRAVIGDLDARWENTYAT